MNLIPQVYAQQGGTIVVPQPPNFQITNIGTLISAAIGLALIIAALLVFVYLIWGGLQYITSGGDKGKTEEARSRISAALVGLAIVAAAWAIIQIIGYFFGINIFGGNVPIPRPF
jgi:hypothetical protein